jgi:hypothetical protein
MSDEFRGAKSGVVGALILIGFGVLLLLNQNGILYWRDVWRLWPMLLVVAGVARMGQMGSTSRFMGGLMIAVGLVLEASEFNLIPYRMRDLWPVGIIAVGLLMLWNSLQPKQSGADPKCTRGFVFPPIAENLAIFGGGERRFSTPDFAGAHILALFGGYKLDLRKAAIKDSSAMIDATAIFGGVEIIVPEEWNVVVRGVGIFGGYVDQTRHPHASEPAPELVVQGIALFGGVEVKN